MLVHISPEPRTVEKRWGGRGKASYRGWKGKVLHLPLLLPPGVNSGHQHVVDETWSSIDSFIVNKVHIFIFSQYLHDLDRGENNCSVAESTVFFFINIHN